MEGKSKSNKWGRQAKKLLGNLVMKRGNDREKERELKKRRAEQRKVQGLL